MDRETLEELQRPLKDRYRKDPGAARITLAAHGTLGEGITCSGDMLLEALAACAGFTLRSVATRQVADTHISNHLIRYGVAMPLHGRR